MGENSKIEWTDHTFNGVRGCAKVSDGCSRCYAETMSHRNPKLLGIWGEEGTRVLASESMWREPLRWERDAKASGVRARVFAYSLGDVFERPHKAENMIVVEDARARLFFSVIPNTPSLDWMLLTKRPENIFGMVPDWWLRSDDDCRCDTPDHCIGPRAGWPSNVWPGTSIENQRAADERIPQLKIVPARMRFLSLEPLLEAVDLRAHLSGIGLVIVGGESGPGARPFDLAWARSIRDQCRAAGTRFFLKQLGAQPRHRLGDGLLYPFPIKDKKGGDVASFPDDLMVREMPEARL